MSEDVMVARMQDALVRMSEGQFQATARSAGLTVDSKRKWCASILSVPLTGDPNIDNPPMEAALREALSSDLHSAWEDVGGVLGELQALHERGAFPKSLFAWELLIIALIPHVRPVAIDEPFAESPEYAREQHLEAVELRPLVLADDARDDEGPPL